MLPRKLDSAALCWTASALLVLVGLLYPAALGWRLGIGLLGVGVQAIGLAVAASGFADTYRAVSNGKTLRSALRQDLVRAFVPSRLPPVELKASMTAGFRAEAHGTVFRPPPPDDAELEAKVTYLIEQVRSLHDQAAKDRTASRKRAREIMTALRSDLAAVDSKLTTEMRTVRAAAFGNAGAGVRKAFVGVVVASTGLLMTATALPW